MPPERTMKSSILENKRSLTVFLNLGAAVKFLFILIIVCGVYYLAGANDLTAKGFELKELKRQTNKLRSENKSLESEITSMGSYNSLNERVKVLGMVSAGSAQYISVKNETVAMR